MSEEKVFSVSVYYSGCYRIDVQAESEDEAKELAIDEMREECGYDAEIDDIYIS